MCFYILDSFRDIHYQNVPKTFGTPCITSNEYNKLFDNANATNKFLTVNLNARSLLNSLHFSCVESLVHSLKLKSQVIRINETWEKPTSSGPYRNQLPRWRSSLIHQKGIKLQYNKRLDLSDMKEGIFESLFVDIIFDNNVLITCGTIYRAPRLDKKSTSEFLFQ